MIETLEKIFIILLTIIVTRKIENIFEELFEGEFEVDGTLAVGFDEEEVVALGFGVVEFGFHLFIAEFGGGGFDAEEAGDGAGGIEGEAFAGVVDDAEGGAVEFIGAGVAVVFGFVEGDILAGEEEAVKGRRGGRSGGVDL